MAIVLKNTKIPKSTSVKEEFQQLRGFPRLLGGHESEACRKARYENFMIFWKSIETRAYVRKESQEIVIYHSELVFRYINNVSMIGTPRSIPYKSYL